MLLDELLDARLLRRPPRLDGLRATNSRADAWQRAARPTTEQQMDMLRRGAPRRGLPHCWRSDLERRC
ncbi:MAG: hypothetical protein MZW92_15295 [Comamonadaceae bacterium]|nr:hypothetical protein [Comamonadaceae bacterium]